jgi:hypothetical protein
MRPALRTPGSWTVTARKARRVTVHDHEIPGRAHPRSSRASRRRVPALRTQCPRPMCPGDAGGARDIDEVRPRPRMSLPARGNRFRPLRNRPARLLSAAMPARHRSHVTARPRPGRRDGRWRVRRRCDRFVSGYVRASAHGSGCNYSAPFRGHASRLSAA